MIETAPHVRHRRKLRPSTKIAIGAVVLVGAAWFAYASITAYLVSKIDLPPIEPKRTNIVAISPESGYRILVANGIAHLAEVSGDFRDYDPNRSIDRSELLAAKKIPIRELLQSLQRNEKALATTIMRMNDLKEDDISKEAPIWTAEDLRKALDGDKTLQEQLEKDLNIGLDGTPPNWVDPQACINGIVIELPVPVRIATADGDTVVTARVPQPYRPQFINAVEKALEERFDADTARAGIYRQRLTDVLEGRLGKEDVRKSLAARISEERVNELRRKPEAVLRHAQVIINEDHIKSARYRNYKTSEKRELNDLTIDLTEEGRQRLWKYSHKRSGFQLLLVVDGVAIAAPRISHELSQREVTINQLPDEDLVKDAVELMNTKSIGGNER